jgi:hypothetical protein
VGAIFPYAPSRTSTPIASSLYALDERMKASRVEALRNAIRLRDPNGHGGSLRLRTAISFKSLRSSPAQ